MAHHVASNQYALERSYHFRTSLFRVVVQSAIGHSQTQVTTIIKVCLAFSLFKSEVFMLG